MIDIARYKARSERDGGDPMHAESRDQLLSSRWSVDRAASMSEPELLREPRAHR